MRAFLLIAAALAAQTAAADSPYGLMPMPAAPQYVAECGSCHTAYAPGYLPARSWKKMLEDLKNHFGDDASLDPATRDLLSAQLQALALDSANANRAVAARGGAGESQRLTTTPFFRYMHDEVPASFWQRAKVGSKANCGACHLKADQGRYYQSEIQIPK